MPAPSTLAEMRVDGRFVGWGLFFIVAGALPLAVQGGYLPSDAASRVWRLWPLILVGLGVGIILGRTPLGWLGSLGNPYELSLADKDGRLGIDLGVYGVPETFVIDKQGIIRYKQIGPITPEVWEQKLAPLIKELS